MAGTLTPFGEAMALDVLFDATAVTRPTAWYVALHTGANGGSGASNEIVGNGYARQPVVFVRVGNGQSNTAVLSFGPNVTVGWGSVTDITVWDSLTAGNCLAQAVASSAVTYAVGDTATIAIGALTITLT
jgi:hypothetical protein